MDVLKLAETKRNPDIHAWILFKKFVEHADQNHNYVSINRAHNNPEETT